MRTPHRVPPDGVVRRSQVLTGNGPGAIVDLVADAVILAGVDAWRYPNDHDCFLPEPRLEAKVQELLSETGWWKHPQVRLREPPPCVDAEASPRIGIPGLRFPRWYLCQGADCRSLVQLKALDRGVHVCRHDVRRGFPVVPIRFVSACTQGHLQDINWRWFVHRGESEAEDEWCRRRARPGRPNDPLGHDWTADLYLLQLGTSGDLTDYIVGCRKCGKSRGLQDLTPPGALGRCPGRRPWLGYNSGEDNCEEDARLITRTASNVYFASVVSALRIPDPAEVVRKAVSAAWPFVSVATRETLPIFRQAPDAAKHLGGLDNEEILAEILRRRTGGALPTPPLRELEAEAFMRADTEVPGELPLVGEPWVARRVELPGLPSFLTRVVLVKSLTEVRAQVGFTRIDANVGDAEGEYVLDVRTAPVGLLSPWVPAVQIHGEGVYLAFDPKVVDKWTRFPGVETRAKQFQRAQFQYNHAHPLPPDPTKKRRIPTFAGERLVMLHTLAHMLINCISLECGYSASSIRERLYCATLPSSSREPDAPPFVTVRAGILLYTGSPGSEGTLGGLVEVGRRMVHFLRRSVEMAMLCSNDPVCAHHAPDDGQEGRHREGAACHGCVLIGEPSCERRNLDLDRALVVPTVDNVEAAFLGDWIRAGMP